MPLPPPMAHGRARGLRDPVLEDHRERLRFPRQRRRGVAAEKAEDQLGLSRVVRAVGRASTQIDPIHNCEQAEGCLGEIQAAVRALGPGIQDPLVQAERSIEGRETVDHEVGVPVPQPLQGEVRRVDAGRWLVRDLGHQPAESPGTHRGSRTRTGVERAGRIVDHTHVRDQQLPRRIDRGRVAVEGVDPDDLARREFRGAQVQAFPIHKGTPPEHRHLDDPAGDVGTPREFRLVSRRVEVYESAVQAVAHALVGADAVVAQRGRPRAALDDQRLLRRLLLEAHEQTRVSLRVRVAENLYRRLGDLGRGAHERRIEPQFLGFCRVHPMKDGGREQADEGRCWRENEPEPRSGASHDGSSPSRDGRTAQVRIGALREY